jgi:monoamine oxidase
MSVPDRYWTWTATGDGEGIQPVVSAFAGEHLGGEFAALMEGAIRSGRSAARALLGSPSGARA